MDNDVVRKFRVTIDGYLAIHAPDCPPVDAIGCFVPVEDRLVQLLLDVEREEFIFSMSVFITNGVEDYIVPEIVADFNAVHLFDGGYHLAVEEETKGLYVSMRRKLGTLTPSEIDGLLRAFVRRSRKWTLWYLEASENYWEEEAVAEAALI